MPRPPAVPKAEIVDVLADGDIFGADPLTAPAAFDDEEAGWNLAFDEVGPVDSPVEVATAAPSPVTAPPPEPLVPERELSPEQKRIRELEHLLALERGRKDDLEPELDVPANPGDTANVVIHFVDDGFTALGKVWYRGQELEFVPGSRAYRDTFDRTNATWLSLRGNDKEQIARYGRVMFREGPWDGRSLVDVADEPFDPLRPVGRDGGSPKPPTRAELEAAAETEQRRGRAAPLLPSR